MGNPTLFYPGDEPTPCWTCKHFVGLHTKDGFAWVNCAERGRFTPAETEVGCRLWQETEKAPNPCGPGA